MPAREQAEAVTTRAADESSDSLQPRADRAGYLAFVAHEMRNPLSTALWSAELLARLSPDDRAGPRGEKLAGMCLRTLARLRHLVEDHFLAERLSIGGIPIRPESVPLAELLDAARSRVSSAKCEGEVEGIMVSADRAMLERALEALIAVAARDGTPVRVRAALVGGAVEIHVDGAPATEDAFRMPDRSTPSDPTGRALGLLMTRAVANAHGGRLDLNGGGYVLTLPDDGGAGDDR